MSRTEFAGLIPLELRDRGEPVFAEPWQAQAFAMTIHLYERGVFTWKEWAGALSREIARTADDEGGTRYYELWLAALENLLAEKTAVSAAELATLRDAWADAYRRTPHGKPVELVGTRRSVDAERRR